MLPNVTANEKDWKYHFNRRERAAREGRHLPTLEELYCGMSFLNGSLRHDAQAWSERIIPSLAGQGQEAPRDPVRIALERLTVSVSLEDLKFVCDEIEKCEATSEKFFEIQCAARRLVVYRVAGGDVSARSLLCEDLVSRIRRLPYESAELWAVSSTLLGLMLNMDSPQPLNGIRTHSLGTFIRDGESMLFRLQRSSSLWEEKAPKETEREVPMKNPANDVPVPNPDGSSIVVFSNIGNVTKRNEDQFSSTLKELIGKKLPLKTVPNLKYIHEILANEFPYAIGIADAILGDLASRDYIAMRPTALVGSPGCGKTTFSQRLGELLELPFETYSCAGINDSSVAGTARRWSSGEPAMPTALVISTRVANPLIILDEIEKAATSKFNGSLLDALLPFLEPRSASKYHDIFIQASVDLSGVVWLATANDVAPLPKPFRDRCRILAFPSPTLADLPAIAPRLAKAIITSRGLDNRWISPLNLHEMEALSAAWSGGSLRSLKRLVEGVLLARDQFAGRH